jgi:hypothetical protein
MSLLSLVSHTRLGSAEPPRSAAARRAGNARRWLPKRFTLCALGLVTAWTLTSVARTPGDLLKGDLQAAGAAIRALGSNQPLDHVQQTVAELFPGHSIEVDAARFPARVVVTLRALDRNTCLDISAAARRIEGKVVIELRGFASPDECGERNDMAWLILP